MFFIHNRCIYFLSKSAGKQNKIAWYVVSYFSHSFHIIFLLNSNQRVVKFLVVMVGRWEDSRVLTQGSPQFVTPQTRRALSFMNYGGKK